jgi:hypothetical protein
VLVPTGIGTIFSVREGLALPWETPETLKADLVKLQHVLERPIDSFGEALMTKTSLANGWVVPRVESLISIARSRLKQAMSIGCKFAGTSEWSKRLTFDQQLELATNLLHRRRPFRCGWGSWGEIRQLQP